MKCGWVLPDPHKAPLVLNSLKLPGRLIQHRLRHAMFFQCLQQPGRLRRRECRFIAAQSFAQVELEQSLVAGKAALRGNRLQRLHHVHRMRSVMVVMGRSLTRRDFRRSDNILTLLFGTCVTRGNHANKCTVDFDVNHEQQSTRHIEANRCFPSLIAARSLHQNKRRITKNTWRGSKTQEDGHAHRQRGCLLVAAHAACVAQGLSPGA